MAQEPTAIAVPALSDAAGPAGPAPTSPRPATLAQQLRQGDRQAMTAIYTAHLDAIYNYCYRRTSSWDAAADLSATVFLEVWRHRRRTGELADTAVLPWLYGVATNVCRNHLRSLRRRAGAMSRLELVETARPGERPIDDQVHDRLETDRRLKVALSRLADLPAADQDVFFLVCWEELSYPEAAQALGIPVGTVRSRLARVRRQLRLSDVAPVPSDRDRSPADHTRTRTDRTTTETDHA